ncbi:hypothetical protein ACEPPN_000715 [Leptodophora sp. 'Broadleaf-Isolate-01']
MAAQTATESRSHNDYTVGWVCALPKEQTAAIAMLDRKHDPLPTPPNDHNIYTLGSVSNHNIVITCLPFGRTGNNSSAAVATRMITTFPSIKFGLMVGIGGGIPPKVRLGDVVVSRPIDEFPGVVQWDMGKAEEGGNFKRTGSLNNPPSALLAALGSLYTEHEMRGPKIPQYLDDLKKNWPMLAPKYTRSDSLKDILFAPDNPHRRKSRYQVIFTMVWESILAFLIFLLGWRAVAPTEPVSEQLASTIVDEGQKGSIRDDGDEQLDDCRFCNTAKVINRKPRDMRVHYGLIASGNQVIKDAKFRDKLNKTFGGNVLCVEMEAAGLMNDFPCIAIRGICDYADSHKNKSWQEHAAAVAAAFAKELLSVLPAQEVEQMPAIKSNRPSVS